MPAILPTSASRSAFELPPRWRQTRPRFVGIDVGVREVQTVSMGTPDDERRLESLRWLSRARFPLPIDPLQPPPPDLVDQVCETLQERLPRCVDGEHHCAVIALPIPWIHYETTTTTDLAVSKASCDAMFEGSIFRCRAHLRHWPAGEKGNHQVVAATAESAAYRIAKAVAQVGYRVQAMLPHGEALLHAARPLTQIDPSAVAVLEKLGGLVSTNRGGHSGLCRVLPACDESEGVQNHLDQLEPWLEQVATEIVATLRYASRLNTSDNIDRPVLLCGSVACLPGVDKLLATMMGQSVATWRHCQTSRPRGAEDSLGEIGVDDAERAVALSLAYCAASRRWNEKR